MEAELLDDVMDVGRLRDEEGKQPQEHRAMVDFFKSIIDVFVKRRYSCQKEEAW